MSGGPVLDTLGRVIGLHAAAEGETLGLKEIQLGFSLGIPTKTVLSSISQAGIKPEWLKVEKVRPPKNAGIQPKISPTNERNGAIKSKSISRICIN